ncbi:putative serine/threonine protein kinase [Blattamonas nauphoetae]|uniref:Serine/threonine protein kinase n=1 Tax=Blattamonas nauphoetae TaxID=2049346 RepID=A0ABQ9Y234_9EUKA|nr:putative serine/threonine protein kinase [Blattamonas nauphoetae]
MTSIFVPTLNTFYSFQTLTPTKKLTVFLPELYSLCDNSFSYPRIAKNQDKVLSSVTEGTQNNGLDNKNGDLIVRVQDIFTSGSQSSQPNSYIVEALLGKGSFGQVFRCLNPHTFDSTAVKVIKNLPAYHKQAQQEQKILSHLRDHNPDEVHCVRLIDDFVFNGHQCFVTELLGDDLYSVLKQGHFKGFSLPLISSIATQLLEATCFSRELKIIHCDLKPENILIDGCLPKIKVIDYGSAVFEANTLFTYIQSRYYRAPEVLLGLPYTSQIDVWSIGCISAELFLGRPLFPGQSEYDQLRRITNMIGPIPADMIRRAKAVKKYYVNDPDAPSGKRFMTIQEHAKLTSDLFQPRVYSYISDTIETTIDSYAARLKRENPRSQRAAADRRPFIDFLKKILNLDPTQRPTPHQMLLHPFLTGEEWKEGWVPLGVEEATRKIKERRKEKPAPNSLTSLIHPPVISLSSKSPFTVFSRPQHPNTPLGISPQSLPNRSPRSSRNPSPNAPSPISVSTPKQKSNKAKPPPLISLQPQVMSHLNPDSQSSSQITNASRKVVLTSNLQTSIIGSAPSQLTGLQDRPQRTFAKSQGTPISSSSTESPHRQLRKTEKNSRPKVRSVHQSLSQNSSLPVLESSKPLKNTHEVHSQSLPHSSTSLLSQSSLSPGSKKKKAGPSGLSFGYGQTSARTAMSVQEAKTDPVSDRRPASNSNMKSPNSHRSLTATVGTVQAGAMGGREKKAKH